MKIMTIEVGGKEYPVCMNARVWAAGEEKYGSVEQFLAAVYSADIALADTIWLLATMLDAGYRAVQYQGEKTEKPPTYNELLDIIDLDDLPQIKRSTIQTTTMHTARKTELEQSKNVETTQQSE